MKVLRSLALQKDGKAVAVGNDSAVFVLTRYNVDGSIDKSFGLDGVMLDPAGADAMTVVIQTDGKILASGYVGNPGAAAGAIARYNPDGTKDYSFGAGGIVYFNFDNYDVSKGIALDNDGKILVTALASPTGQYSDPTAQERIGLLRLNTDGSLDSSFGNDGKMTAGEYVPFDWTFVQSIKENKAIISSTTTNGNGWDMVAARINSNGTLDESFGNNGYSQFNVDGNQHNRSIEIDTKSQIYLCGKSESDDQNVNFFVGKLKSNGKIDNAFGNGKGYALIDFGGADSSQASALQVDGRIILAGKTSYNGEDSIALARCLGSGKLDNSFGNGGRVVISGIDKGAAWFEVTDVVVKSNGDIITLFSTGYSSYSIAFDSHGKVKSGYVVGSAADDSFTGTDKTDLIYGYAGVDHLNGGDGDDAFYGGEGDDVIDGGTGNNTVNYSDTTNDVMVDLSAGTATGEGADTLQNIQNAVGGEGDDSITGNAAANVLTGGVGNDDLIGGLGNDVLDGGSGFDCADYQASQSNLTINLATGKASGADIGTDKLTGIEEACAGAGNDSLTAASTGSQLEGNAGNDSLIGGVGNDVLLGGADNDNLLGGAGNDALDGGAGNDVLKGGAGNDTLDGGNGIDTADYSDKTKAVEVTLNGSTDATVKVNGLNEDTIKNIENLIGGSGNDLLTGDSAANVLSGGAGNDTLKGGEGADQITGGKGADRFVFNDFNSKDKVTDFKEADKDKLVFDATVFTSLADGVNAANLAVNTTGLAADDTDYLIFNSSNKTLYYDADGNGDVETAVAVVELTGVSSLQASDFIIV